MKYVMCIDCGSFDTKICGDIVCKKCGKAIDISSYQKALEYANRCYYYWVMYRKAYEGQLKADGYIHIKYSLVQPTDVQELLALVVISGILGNLSYDILKKLTARAISYVKDRCSPQEEDSFNAFATDECIRFFEDHLRNKEINPFVQEAIVEEQIVDKMTEYSVEQFENNKDLIEDSRPKPMRQTREQIVKQKKQFKKEYKKLKKKALLEVAEMQKMPDLFSSKLLANFNDDE